MIKGIHPGGYMHHPHPADSTTVGSMTMQAGRAFQCTTVLGKTELVVFGGSVDLSVYMPESG